MKGGNMETPLDEHSIKVKQLGPSPVGGQHTISLPFNPADRRAAALAAIEARLRPEVPSDSPPLTPQEEVWVQPSEKEDNESRKAFSKLLDRGIVRDNGYKQSADAVETLLKIANNILNSREERFRTLKASNNALKNKILNVKGGHEYLIAMGFRVQTVDFTQTYILLPSMKRMHELKLGAEVLQEHLTGIQARAAAESASKLSAAEDDARRKARALREIEDDRDSVKRRVERERIAREQREKAAREQAEKEKEEEERALREGVPVVIKISEEQKERDEDEARRERRARRKENESRERDRQRARDRQERQDHLEI